MATIRSKLLASPSFSTIILVAIFVFVFDCLVISRYEAAAREKLNNEQNVPSSQSEDPARPRLAVVVPSHAGDLEKAIESLKRWPQKCHHLTLESADLILYYAGGPNARVGAILPYLKATGGRCFANTRIVFASLTKKESVYPKGASVQFYKLFLDPAVRSQVSAYGALALIEWDVLVAHDRSFEMLYRSAFGSVEPFWIKGSILEGTNFHDTVIGLEQRHILGHINGNAIYNNTDPGFVDFIEYTLARWKFDYSYDVALWASVADFPYSWPLWQRFSRKFVTTNLIANVGFFDVDETTVRKAVEVNTLFIHGSQTGGGAMLHGVGAKAKLSKAQKKMESHSSRCNDACGREAPAGALNGTWTVCDGTCLDGKGRARFDGYGCGAGEMGKFGKHCRLCYTDINVARQQEALLLGTSLGKERDDVGRIIMCDTKLPPPAASCNPSCATKTDSVCDQSCGTGRFGDYNCNWRDYGIHCRFCFRDLQVALVADEVAKRRGGRVIMCDTFEPPVAAHEDDWPASPFSTGVEEQDQDGHDGQDGFFVDLGNLDELTESTENVDSSSSSSDVEGDDDPESPDMIPFTKDMVRGELCAFMYGYYAFLSELTVIVEGMLHFMPGMRIAIATNPSHFSVFNRTLGSLPLLRVGNASNPVTAPLFADRYCGEGTKLIYYMSQGEMISRKITEKDTHSVHGDVLVVYSTGDAGGELAKSRARATTRVLGFSSPSFSSSDIVLPVELNMQLRQLLVGSRSVYESSADNDDLASSALNGIQDLHVPEVLAALAYSRRTLGIWFINPKEWVTQHMFRPASVWDIPLVKPRFGCFLDMSRSLQGYDMTAELSSKMKFFINGGRCENGYLAVDTGSLAPKPSIEFGPPTGRPMPDVASYSVSVVYSLHLADENVLRESISSVINRFPSAFEMVVVFGGDETFNKRRLLQVVNRKKKSAPFPIKIVDAEASGSRGQWHRVQVGELCQGDFVLHMEAGDVLLEDITYDNIFHFGKPVIPFGRFSWSGLDEDEILFQQCLSSAMSSAIGAPIVHDFALSKTSVYPTEVYQELREFIRETHHDSLRSFIQRERRKCRSAYGDELEIPTLLYEINLLGAFLWYYMNDAVHWRATNALDLRPDEWLQDVNKYHFSCDVGRFPVPPDENDLQRFVNGVRGIDSRANCEAFGREWVEM